MIEFARNVPRAGFHGRVTSLRRSAGIQISRVEHDPSQEIDGHAHDWDCLTIFRCGGYAEHVDGASFAIDGPAAVFRPAGAAHANIVGPDGLETLSVLIDPTLIPERAEQSLTDGRAWRGGNVGRAVPVIATALLTPSVEPRVSIINFLSMALTQQEARRPPPWLGSVRALIEQGVVSTTELAARLRLHPAWLARAYLQATGESVQGYIRRRRVEQALRFMRAGDYTFAAIAAEVGFCDQSHMARSFNAILGRPPSAVRAATEASAATA